MPLPKIINDNPETVIIDPDKWTLIAEAVNIVKLNNIFSEQKVVWYTYVKTGDLAPVGLSIPKWRINEAVEELTDSNTQRDYYVYPVDDEAEITIEITGTIPPGAEVPIDVVVQSNTSPWNDFYFVQANGAPTELTDPVLTAGDTRIFKVLSVANISIGDWLGVFSGASGQERYYWAFVEDINGLDLTMDTLIDYPFPAGAAVLSTTRNMAVNGAITPQVFSIQAGGTGGVLEIDISRVMLSLLCTDTVDLSKFGDIVGGLVRPMFLRVKENGVYRNKLGAKTNKDLALMAYDWNPFSTINPQQGQNGFLWRFSIGGPDKHDAVSRVSGGNIGSLEWVIQSDQSTQIIIESVGANSEVTA